jgi:hypothetical protein
LFQKGNGTLRGALVTASQTADYGAARQRTPYQSWGWHAVDAEWFFKDIIRTFSKTKIGLDGECPDPSSILMGMQNNSPGILVEELNRMEATEKMAAVADCRYREDAHPALPIIDELRASQARSEFIKATIIFFGLDGECPSHSGNLSA